MRLVRPDRQQVGEVPFDEKGEVRPRVGGGRAAAVHGRRVSARQLGILRSRRRLLHCGGVYETARMSGAAHVQSVERWRENFRVNE